MKLNLFVTGLPGSGKKTIAKMLKEDFGYNVVEVREILMVETGKDICNLVHTYGIKKIAQMERKIVARFEKKCGIIIVGCGLASDFSSEHFLSVYLKSSKESFLNAFKRCAKMSILEKHFSSFHSYYSKNANLVITIEHKMKFEVSRIISDFYRKNITETQKS